MTLLGPFHKNLSIIFSISLIISGGVSIIEDAYNGFGRRKNLIIATLPKRERPLNFHKLVTYLQSFSLSWKFCCMYVCMLYVSFVVVT